MSLTYEKLMSLMDANKSIKEFCIIEGKALFLGFLKQLDEPIIRNGRLITEAIFTEKCDDFGVIHRNECLNVLKGFEKSTKVHLYLMMILSIVRLTIISFAYLFAISP
ncbi:hypothetical protein P4T70_24580 [Bacillus mobilis]|uniref:hypothetical protein n=1 Tax=Bacillus mobilis TaxID=2026190 RepID=UPI002E1B2CB5|nr:hypothetical protein [Bacillus mobilis]